MLHKVSEDIRECYDRAAEAGQRAKATANPKLKAEYLDMQRRWLRLAHSYEFSESLESFLDETEKRKTGK